MAEPTSRPASMSLCQCTAGYNIRWLLRAIVRLGLKGFFAPLLALLGMLAAAFATATAAGKTGSDRQPWRFGEFCRAD